jgi:hypothetical protein
VDRVVNPLDELRRAVNARRGGWNDRGATALFSESSDQASLVLRDGSSLGVLTVWEDGAASVRFMTQGEPTVRVLGVEIVVESQIMVLLSPASVDRAVASMARVVHEQAAHDSSL